MLTRALWGGCHRSARELRSLVTSTTVWKPATFSNNNNQLVEGSGSASPRSDQDAEPSSASVAGLFASSLQQHRGYSAVPRPPPPPYNTAPGQSRTPPQNPDPWAELEGQSGPAPSQSSTQTASDAQRGPPQASDPWAELEGSTSQRPAPSSSAAGGSQRQGSHPSSSQRQPPPRQGSLGQPGRPLGRSQGATEQQGGPPGERDPWAELEGQASRPPSSRGSPPGGFQGGFSGGFQGRSRELVNLKQRQAGIVSIMSSNNNTIMTLSDTNGRVQSCISAGCLGFSNSRKSTTQAAEAVGEAMAEKARSLGFTTCEVNMKGMGFGKQRAVRAMHGAGMMITAIHEKTPVAHNGCRRPRKRRG
ncbi:g2262 [Coccomyxa viridis]|uniref:G2262 protein n=1 Tax=Coccomyxa viridis TaxID=1274662 RepID=A0ABP1FK00_9CHLO